MAKGDEKKLVPPDVEPIDDSVVSNPEPELGPALQAVVRKRFEAPS